LAIQRRLLFSFQSVLPPTWKLITGFVGSKLTPSLFSIVVVTSIVVAATASAISSRFGAFSRVGGIIGTSVSAGFLIILGLLNIYICYKLVEQLRKLIKSSPNEEQTLNIQGAGCPFYLFKKMFKLIDK